MSKLVKIFAVALVFTLYANMTFATPSSPSVIDQEYDPQYWDFGWGENVKFSVPGSTFSASYDSGSETYSWHNAEFAGIKLTGSFAFHMGYYSVVWQGVSQSFTSYTEARKYLDKKFVELVTGNGGVISSTGSSSPIGPVHDAANLNIENIVAPTIKSRQLWNPGKKKARNANATPNLLQSSDKAQAYAPPATATSSIAWDDSASSSIRYEKRWFENDNNEDEAELQRVGATLRFGFDWDRVALDIMVPLDRVDYNSDYDFLDFTRVGVVITPRFYLLTQEEYGVDLTAGLSGSYYHTFMDKGNVDPDHASIGPMFGLQKDFDKFSLAGGVIWQRGFNLDGDDEITKENHVDVIKVAANLGLPIAERWALNTNLVYSHISNVPADIDEDFYTLGVSANYVLKDTWTLDFGLKRDLGNSDSDNIMVTFGAVWTF